MALSLITKTWPIVMQAGRKYLDTPEPPKFLGSMLKHPSRKQFHEEKHGKAAETK